MSGDTQKIIDNHYMRYLRKSSSVTVGDHEQQCAAMSRLEVTLIDDGSDLAINYITAPIDDRFALTSMYDG